MHPFSNAGTFGIIHEFRHVLPPGNINDNHNKKNNRTVVFHFAIEVNSYVRLVTSFESHLVWFKVTYNDDNNELVPFHASH